MGNKKAIVMTIMILILFMQLSMTTYAGNDGIEFAFTEPTERYTPYSRVSNSLKSTAGILNLTVNKNKNVAIALLDGTILIYNEQGILIHQFKFKNSGSYKINYSESDPNLLEILEIRGEIAYIVKEDGTLVDTKKWDYNVESNQINYRYYKNKEFTVYGDTYRISHVIPITRFYIAGDKVEKIDAEGNILEIYYDKAHSVKVLVVTCLTICIMVTWTVGLYYYGFIMPKRKRDNSDNR